MKRLILLVCALTATCSSETPRDSPGKKDAQADSPAGDAMPDGSSVDASDASVDGGDSCGPVGAAFTRCEKNPLYTAGAKHADGRLELFIADPSVLYDEDEGKWKAWWQSPLDADYLAPDPATAILYAESSDGVTWTVEDKPVLSAKGAPADWDYDRVETPTVIKVPTNPPDRRYVMFYSGGNFAAVQSSVAGYVWYQIGVAYSADGRSFQRPPASESPYAGKTTPYQNIAGLLLLGRDAFPGMAGVDDGLVADPEVVIVGDTWHLFFSSMAVDAAKKPLAFGVSHATSKDGVQWTQAAGNPQAGGMQPSVVWNPKSARFELFFNADTDAEKATAATNFNVSVHLSHATSPDGNSFQLSNPKHVFDWDASHTYEAYGWLTGADAVLRPDGYWLFYTGFSNQSPPQNFFVPANEAWCATAGSTCTCYTEDAGQKTCLLASVVTLDLARRAAD